MLNGNFSHGLPRIVCTVEDQHFRLRNDIAELIGVVLQFNRRVANITVFRNAVVVSELRALATAGYRSTAANFCFLRVS